ncbi:MAG: GNAT family N-acetyltransferase [Omnitrophica WOR_2 bacterium]
MQPIEAITLSEPAICFEEEYLRLAAEFDQAGEDFPNSHWPGEEFTAFVWRVRGYSRGVNLPRGWVPFTTFWLIKNGATILGISDLRHRLNPSLEVVGGHIGYVIRPSQRRKGYGTLILARTLVKAKDLGLTRVLLTCDSDNTGSARIIEKNGGILTREFFYSPTGKMKSHYWIPLREE